MELSLFIILFCIFLNFAILRDYAYPPFIFSIIWFLTLFAYYILSNMNSMDTFYLSNKTLIFFTAGVLSFTIGGIINYFNSHIHRKIIEKEISINIKEIKINPILDNIFFILPLLFLPLFIHKAMIISSQSGIDNFFIGLRSQLIYGEEDYGTLKYIVPLSLFNVLFRGIILQKITNKKRGDKLKYYISVMSALVYVIFSTGRTFILLLLTFLIGPKIIIGRLQLKHLVYFSLSFLLFFFLFAMTLNKGGSWNIPLVDNITNVSTVFSQYLTGPLIAFNLFLENQSDLHYGQYLFRFVYAVLYKTGLIGTSPVDLIQPFVSVPYRINVYTVYYFYAKDFGVIASLLFIFFFGFWHSFFYFKVKVKTSMQNLSLYVYILLLYPLFMSFFQDQYFPLTSMWIQFILFYVFLRMSR